MRLRVLIGAICCAATTFTIAPSAHAFGNDIHCPATNGHPKAIVLVLHAGGWWIGSAINTKSQCQAFADAGYDAISVDYPLFNYFQSLKYAENDAAEARKSGLPVYSYGISAGANLSAMLGDLRKVDAAVVVSAPSDLTRWDKTNKGYYKSVVKLPTMHDREMASPYYRWSDRSCPLLIMHGPIDKVVPYNQSVRFAKKSHSELITLKGGHLADPSALPKGIKWIEERTGRCNGSV